MDLCLRLFGNKVIGPPMNPIRSQKMRRLRWIAGAVLKGSMFISGSKSHTYFDAVTRPKDHLQAKRAVAPAK